MKQDKYKLLSNIFGHKNFRNFQEDAIDTILNGQDLLTILPTGGGKSLCYQLPALMIQGTAIVISPLIALMQDQVLALRVNGIKANMISSAQSLKEITNIIKDIKEEKLQLLYIAPERFSSNGFLHMLQSIKISFFVIDEAHCLSEWGHEFRSDYRNLHILKQYFPNIPISAFTATATLKVQEDIVNTLNIKNCNILRGQTKRDNLNIAIKQRVSNGRIQLLDFLQKRTTQLGIVYTFTRKEADTVTKFLQEKNFKAKAYHAGLSNRIREKVYKDFLYDKINIVVATIAFGMGIDKSNIRFVVHTSMAKTMENFYQEIGRAGRDGLPSDTLLLYSKADEIKRKAFISQDINNQYKDLLETKLEFMYRFCISSSCRHKIIASYFSDEIGKCKKLCDNCTKKDIKQLDISIESQKFLSTLYRTNQSFGAVHIIDILRGSKVAKISQFNHQNLSVYGIAKDKSKNEWSAVVDRLLDLEAIMIGEYKALKITSLGYDILKSKTKVFIDEDKIGQIQKDKVIKTKQIFDINMEYFEKFKVIRTTLSQEQNVPSYIIFNDKVLVELSSTLPTTKEEMLLINGIGEVKYERYGKVFLDLCKSIKWQTKKFILD
jgi:ATP-dependent DNA helicase RecQ